MRIKSHKLDYESKLSSNFLNPQYITSKIVSQNATQLDDTQSPPWQGTQQMLAQYTQSANQKSVGDLKLVKEGNAIDLQDLYENFNYDNIMDENVALPPAAFITSEDRTPKLIPKQPQSLALRKTVSSQNLTKQTSWQRYPVLIQQPFSVQTLHNQVQNRSYTPNIQSFQQHLDKPHSTKFELIAKKDIFWTFKDSSEAPQIEFDIYVDEFASSTFEFVLLGNRNPEVVYDSKGVLNSEGKQQIILKSHSQIQNQFPDLVPIQKMPSTGIQNPYAVKLETRKKSEDNSSYQSLTHFIDHKLIGHCFVSMNRFCSQDITVLAEDQNMVIQEIRFEDRIQKHGLVVGEVKGEFVMSNNPFLRQMMGSIKTEEGIQQATILYVRKDKYATKTGHVSKILQTNIHLDDLICRLNQKDMIYKDRSKINEQIAITIRSLRQILVESQNDIFRNDDELRRAQLVLTDLAKNLLEYADMIDEHLRSTYYEILVQLLMRPEFHLNFMGFDKRQRELFEKRDDPHIQKTFKKEIGELDKKIRVGLHYQNFLYKTLDNVFKKVQQKGSNQQENQFVYNFMVQAYIRVPELQQCILQTLVSENKFLGESFEGDLLAPPPNQVISNDLFLTSFEWQEQFYDVISQLPRGQEHMKFLQQSLNEVNWNKLIHKQGYVFLKFITHLCKTIKKSKDSQVYIPWNSLPGYGLLVRKFLLELKSTDQYPYPDVFKEVSASLLENEQLLNYFLYVIYNKTKMYDGIAVFYTFDLIGFWFETLRLQNKKVPTNFNFLFFLQGIYLIFEGEHTLSMAKALQLIYNIFPQLPIEIQKELCEYLFEKCFFKLFMFWSKTVRWVFHQFLIFRIQHLFRNLKTDINKVRDIEKEFLYLKVKKEGKFAQQEKVNLINDMIYLKYSQMIEIVIKMKKVLIKNMQQQDRTQLQTQLEANSWKLKLLKKRIHRKRARNSSESPLQDNKSVDISLQSQLSSLNSLTLNLKNDSSRIVSEESRNQAEPLDENNYEQYLEERSLASILNLDDILQEIALEKKEKQRENRYRQRNNSVEFKESDTLDQQKKGALKKITIYHRMNYYNSRGQAKLEVPKELLRYLIAATQEWQEQQSKYKRWFLSKRAELVRMKLSEDQQLKLLMSCEPPEINLSVPKDESESNVDQDW